MSAFGPRLGGALLLLFSIAIPSDGEGQIILDTEGTRAAAEAIDQDDIWIVSLGDSFSFGEGNPHNVLAPFNEWKWLDPGSHKCHRSRRAWPYLVAQWAGFEFALWEDPDLHFTFLACSGATLKDDLLNEFLLARPNPRVPQLLRLAEMIEVAGRPPHAVLLTGGGNDLGFADIVTECIGPGNCPGGDATRLLADRMQLLSAPNGLYAQVAARLEEMGVPAQRVFLVGYPNPLIGRRYNLISGWTEPRILAKCHIGAGKKKWRWAHSNVIVPLQELLREVAATHGWRLIEDHYEPFSRHSYCPRESLAGGDSWWVGILAGSILRQWHYLGAFHPNRRGHKAIADAVYPAVVSAIQTDVSPLATSSETRREALELAKLQGPWVRRDSNNPRNDGMRIRVEGSRATLTAMPSSGSRKFSVGQVVWQDLSAKGTLRVRGSDGAYYPASLTLEGSDRLQIDVNANGPGNDQTWDRAGPSIDGDWVLVASSDDENEGIRIRVEGGRATLRYVPPRASRNLRTGDLLWREIRAGGTLEVLADSRRYATARYRLRGSERLRLQVDETGMAQNWARPELAEELLAAGEEARDEEGALIDLVREPEPDPAAAGGELKPAENLPRLDIPEDPTAPVPEPVGPAACVSTSRHNPQTSRPWGEWGLSLTSPTNDDPLEMSLGIWDHMIADFDHAGARRLGRAPVDIERSRIPGLEDGFGFVWERNRRIFWDEHRNLTSTELDQQMQAARGAGNILSDIEAYATSSGIRYAGIWVRNVSGIDWKVDYELTGAEYGSAFQSLRNNGYRLVDMEAYQTTGGLRYAAIWHQSCDDTNWRQRRDMDRTHYQQWVDDYGAQGFRVIDIESYQTSNGQRYAAIWERIPAGTAWAVRSGRTLKWFLNYHRQYVDEGLKLIDYESYETADGIRYAGVWAEFEARYDFAFKGVVDTMVQNYRARHAIPGISVVLIQDGEVIYRRGFGWADSADQKRAHSGTIYALASVSKAIGGTLAALLEERQDIDLTDTTADILDYLGNTHTHTVEQLLSKTGCIRHYGLRDPDQRSDNLQRVPSRYYRWRETAIDSIQSPLLSNCTPGKDYFYSTHGFTFVGAALEEELGKDIVHLVRDELSLPFELTSLARLGTFPVAGSSGPVPFYNLAQGYDYVATTNGWQEVDYDETNWKVLGGGLQMHAMDLARFGWLTLNGDIVSGPTRDNRLWDPLTDAATIWNSGPPGTQPDTTALAWVVEGRNPARTDPLTGAMVTRRVAEHSGSWLGARSLLRIYRDDGLIIAILTNQRNSAVVNRHPIGVMRPVNWDLATNIATAVFSNPP